MAVDSASELLFAMRLKGVRIWNDNGQLRYQATRGSLTPAEIEKLRSLRDEIIAFSRQAVPVATEPPLVPRLTSDPIPLTFSQQLRWRLFELQRCPSTRSVFTAIRLLGRLNVKCLRQSFAELVRRHEALRTRFVVADGLPRQEIADAWEHELEAVD